MDAKQTILTRQLPKTGQVESFFGEDDGDVEAGWWKGRDKDTNKTRFISKTIGDNGEVVVIDRATGLMWAADGDDRGCFSGGIKDWLDAIRHGSLLNFAGFTDWRIPNILELASIIDFSIDGGGFHSVFTNTKVGMYWTSTTNAHFTTFAWCVHMDTQANIWEELKTNDHYLRCVRGGV